MPFADLGWLDADTWPPLLALFVICTATLTYPLGEDLGALLIAVSVSAVAVIGLAGIAALIA